MSPLPSKLVDFDVWEETLKAGRDRPTYELVHPGAMAGDDDTRRIALTRHGCERIRHVLPMYFDIDAAEVLGKVAVSIEDISVSALQPVRGVDVHDHEVHVVSAGE